MQYTKNYEFKKPESDDFYNVEDFNENVEKIDKELKSNAEKIDTVSTSVDDIANAVGTEKLQTTAQSIIPAINEVSSVAKGKNRAKVFATTESMNEWLSNPANARVAQVGDNLYIVDVGVSDWWISEVLTEPDEAGRYYKIAQLETQKVDLTTYEARIQKNANDISALNNDLANKGIVRFDATGSEIIDCTAYNGKMAIISVTVDGNGYLNITMPCIINNYGSFAVNGAGDSIDARVMMDGGKFHIEEAHWGTDDKLSTSKLIVRVLNY